MVVVVVVVVVADGGDDDEGNRKGRDQVYPVPNMIWSTSLTDVPSMKCTVLLRCWELLSSGVAPATNEELSDTVGSTSMRRIVGCRAMPGWKKATSPKNGFGFLPTITACTGSSAVWTRSKAISAAETEAPTTTTR